MKRLIYVVLLCLATQLITTESIVIHKTNRGSTKHYGNSLHGPMNISNKDDINEINYFNPRGNVYASIVKIENNEFDTELNDSNERGFNENYVEEDLIDEIDFNKINVLTNKELLQKLKKAYDEDDLENKKLIKHIKGILSRALHIPPKEINLHDVNVLMNKWRIMNKHKQNMIDLKSNNKYHKEIKTHIPKQTDTIDWEFKDGYDMYHENAKNNTISFNYFLDLIS